MTLLFRTLFTPWKKPFLRAYPVFPSSPGEPTQVPRVARTFVGLFQQGQGLLRCFFRVGRAARELPSHPALYLLWGRGNTASVCMCVCVGETGTAVEHHSDGHELEAGQDFAHQP